ncbi:MAG: hypothetical protein ACYC1P_06285 [Gaiellaceae bacterium]
MRSAAALSLVACFITAGCGGSSSAQEEPEAPTLEELRRAPGEDVAIVPGSADFGPGTVRLTFLVVDGQCRLVTRPTARIWLARALEEKPFAETAARTERIGVDVVQPGQAEEIFVTELELDEPGTYWLPAEPVCVAFATPRYCTSRTCGPVDEGREPLGAGVEAAVRAVDLRRRGRRDDPCPLRGHRLRPRARRGFALPG